MNTDPQQSTHRAHINFDLRIIVVVLVVIIIAMLLIWKPWSTSSSRTIEVTGEATLSATPDEFTFNPIYQFQNADKNAAIAAISKKSDELVAALKNLGVPDSGIKTNANGYETMIYRDKPDDVPTYTLQLTATVNNQELAQKVQDYLLTTGPTGTISPQPAFSEAKRNELEATARDQATKDARAKADQMAKNLGFKVGKVKAVSDGTGFNAVFPGMGRADIALDSTAPEQPNLSIQPGENKLPYSVTVIYFIR